MTYTRAAVERAMKVQEVISRALSGRQSWLQVADVLGVSPRTVRRWRWRYEQYGYVGLLDHRLVYRPLPRGVGRALFYRCPWCRKLRRYLYPFSLVGDRLVAYQGLRCQPCAGLRFAAQGLYRSRIQRTLGPYPRFPRDPRVVSDPRLLAAEAGADPTTLVATGKLKLMTDD